MGKYAVTWVSHTTSTTATTAAGVFPNATGEQAEVIEVIMCGAGAVAAADTQTRCQVAACTFGATGVSTSVTAMPFNQVTQAALSSCGSNYTTEPTAYATVQTVVFSFNQRGGMRWAVPQGEGMQLNNGPTNKGAGVRSLAVAAGSCDGSVHFWEP